MNKALLFINGNPPKDFPSFDGFQSVFCTDGAYHYLKSENIKPDVVIGDFDSYDKDLIPDDIEVIYAPDQDFTDFDKALKVIMERGFEEVQVYGPDGGEQDHFLGNLTTACKFKDKIRIVFNDSYSFYFFADYETEIQGYKDRMISLYPFPAAKEFTSTGVLYPLYKTDLSITGRIGTRNTITEDLATISFTEGNLLVFIGY